MSNLSLMLINFYTFSIKTMLAYMHKHSQFKEIYSLLYLFLYCTYIIYKGTMRHDGMHL